MNLPQVLPDWSRAHGGTIMNGRIRQKVEDFAVTEVLGFEPDGEGEHDFLWIEKRNTNTNWLARQLADFAGIPARDVGYAGMKDRNAVTRQWFSVRRPAGAAANWSALDVAGIDILETSRNSRKLRRGAHSGNHFRIVVSEISSSEDKPADKLIQQRVMTIGEQGVPNYFGEQRFGREGGNLPLAESLFAGKRLNRDKRSIALSAARSWLFNHVLQDRVAAGTWSQLLAGDIVSLDGSGSVFAVDTIDETIETRCRELDVHPTGPLWGESSNHSATETAVVERFPTLVNGLEKQAKASRRSLRLAVRDLNAKIESDSIELDFYLARGGFATAVLREIANYC